MAKVYAYIDETGDRGSAANSSPVFGMAAVLVPEAHVRELRDAVARLRADLRVPLERMLSWKEYAKTHERRRRAAEVLGALSGIRVCYVYASKADLRPGTYVEHKERFYNYVAYKTYKSVVWAARNMGGSEVLIRFGHVRHHDQTTTKAYIERAAAEDPKVPNELVTSLRWVSADAYEESQAADLFGGFLKAAVWPSGPFGYVEPSYLLQVWPLLQMSETCAIPLGIMSMPHHQVLTAQPWFPCAHCRK